MQVSMLGMSMALGSDTTWADDERDKYDKDFIWQPYLLF